MGDEDRSQELPQRVRGAARAGPSPPARPVLSEEVRQRIRAAVRAERGEAVGQDQELASEPERRVTASGPGRPDGGSPDPSSVNGATDSAKRAVPLLKSQRTAAPAAPVRTAAPAAPVRTAAPAAPVRTAAPAALERIAAPAAPRRTAEPIKSGRTAEPIKSGRTVEPVKVVKRQPSAKPQPTDIAPADHRPRTGRRADRSERPWAVEREKPVRRHFVAARLVGSALAVIAAVSLAVAVTRYFTSSPADVQASAVLQAQEAAGTWVAQQVSRDVIVSCDQVMCGVLKADGFPPRKLLVLGSKSPYARDSDVLVETAAVRDLFGPSLNDYAPAVLATFGSRDSKITVRVVARDGAAAYYKALAADLNERKAAETALVQENVLTVSATARNQLVAGRVDSRLMLAIANLVTDEPVDVVEFGNIGPGGDADMPLRYADLAENDQAAHLAGSAYVQRMRTDLDTGPAEYRPASTATVVLPGGQTVLRIEFTAPTSPLGLLVVP